MTQHLKVNATNRSKQVRLFSAQSSCWKQYLSTDPFTIRHPNHICCTKVLQSETIKLFSKLHWLNSGAFCPSYHQEKRKLSIRGKFVDHKYDLFLFFDVRISKLMANYLQSSLYWVDVPSDSLQCVKIQEKTVQLGWKTLQQPQSRIFFLPWIVFLFFVQNAKMLANFTAGTYFSDKCAFCVLSDIQAIKIQLQCEFTEKLS